MHLLTALSPFAGLTGKQLFAKSYASQLCRKAASGDSVKLTLHIRGGQEEMSAPMDEPLPEAMRVTVRGAIPRNDWQICELARELEVR
ncbi:MAG TPA: hypothetical protein VGR02_07730 [Thermoanaerobaculia bacterium]|jgi:hypothetical protein|nr:hypothetical protein [Thermoanaerobaculia bacterium]